MPYVSITGFTVRGPWAAPRFWWLTLRAMAQARRAPGNLVASGNVIDGVAHTLTAWEDRAAMRAFLTSGAHARAMRAMPGLGSGRTVGRAMERVPDWTEARAIWDAEAREV